MYVHICKLNEDHKSNLVVKMQVNTLFELSTPNKSTCTCINAHMSHCMGTSFLGILQPITIQTGMLSYRDQLKS